MIMPTKTVDVTASEQKLADFIRSLGIVRQPIAIMLAGKVVARLVPPEELSEAEKEHILQEGWNLVEQARARNRSLPERDIAKIVNQAIKRVRSQR